MSIYPTYNTCNEDTMTQNNLKNVCVLNMLLFSTKAKNGSYCGTLEQKCSTHHKTNYSIQFRNRKPLFRHHIGR